jgi:hypothetical protein
LYLSYLIIVFEHTFAPVFRKSKEEVFVKLKFNDKNLAVIFNKFI